MAGDSAQVIDELIVKLTLQIDEYKKAQRAKDKLVDATEDKEKKADKEREKRDKNKKNSDAGDKRRSDDQRKRLDQTERAIKSLGTTLKTFALTTAAVFGLGAGVGGIVNAITNLAGFETNLRRAAVSTGLSNREMQAWGATAKRLGADANAGAAAIAALAREQKQFNLTGQGPTMQALARMGVNVTPGSKIEDVLAQAQSIYRSANPAQQQQIEAQLSAQGVSDDLIVMIKSETDAREAYQRSLADSVEENKATMKALNDAMTSLQQASLQLANVIAVAATPYIQEFSNWVHNLASDPHKVDAFLSKTADALGTLGDVAVKLSHALKDAWAVVNAIAHPIAGTADSVKGWLNKTTNDFNAENPGGGTPIGLFFRRALHSTLGIGTNPDLNMSGDTSFLGATDDQPWNGSGGAGASPGASGGGGLVSAQDFAQMLVQRGLTPAQAMAATANALREAPGSVPGTIDPSAVNPNGGASGVFQWTGERKATFQRIFGMDPNQADVGIQLDFATGNATEWARMQKAFATGGDAQALGTHFSQIYEAHGIAAEDIRRGALAAQLAQSSGGTMAAGAAGTQINLNGPVTVQANDPQELVGGIQRVALVQNYNTAVR
jgi:hypothetical protein